LFHSSLISNYLEPVAYFTYSVAIILYTWTRKENFRFKILSGYYVISTALMIKASATNVDDINIDLYDFLFLLTSIGFGIYFYIVLPVLLKRVVVVFICSFEIIYFVFNNIIFKGPNLFDSTAYVILSTGIVIMIFMFMHQILTNVSDKSLWANFEFWFVSSLMIYFLGSFVIFLTFSYLTRKILPAQLYSLENRDLVTAVWGVHNVLLFLGSLLTLGSLIWISFRKKLQLS
jgi:hypothetical protein